MKYFDINEKRGAVYAWDDIKQNVGFPRTLSPIEKLHVLEEQLRPAGLQPVVVIDGSGVEIITASKKFLNRERCHSHQISNRARQYMEFCEKGVIE